MRKLLFACMLSFGTLAATASNPVISAYWSVTRFCINHLTFSVSGTSNSGYWVQVAPLIGPNQLGPNIYNNYGFPQAGSVSMVVSPSSPTTYNIWAMDNSNTLNVSSVMVTVYPPCSIRKIVVNNHDWTARTLNVGPEDPGEGPGMDGMEVRWSVEELNPNNWEPYYTIDNPSCWAASNMGGASNSFPGFDNVNNTYGGTMSDLLCENPVGTFESGRIYRVTRYYRNPGDDEWQQDQVLVGPGYDEPSSGGRTAAPGTIASDGASSLQLKLAQDDQQEQVKFNTTVDNGTLDIYDVSGNLIRQIELKSGTFEYELKTAELAPGMYVAYLRSGEQVTSEKFILR